MVLYLILKVSYCVYLLRLAILTLILSVPTGFLLMEGMLKRLKLNSSNVQICHIQRFVFFSWIDTLKWPNVAMYTVIFVNPGNYLYKNFVYSLIYYLFFLSNYKSLFLHIYLHIKVSFNIPVLLSISIYPCLYLCFLGCWSVRTPPLFPARFYPPRT